MYANSGLIIFVITFVIVGSFGTKHPIMIDEIPILAKYCPRVYDINEYTGYYCRNLEEILFDAANKPTRDDRSYFNKIDTGFICRYNKETAMKWDISYHVEMLMEKTETLETQIETCHLFQDVCYKYVNAYGFPDKEKNSTETSLTTFFMMSKFHYVFPNMTEEVPILAKYCPDTDDLDEDYVYHCRNLRRILFRVANMPQLFNDYYFQRITQGTVCNGDEHSIARYDIDYHTRMLTYRETKEFQTVAYLQFIAAYNKYVPDIPMLVFSTDTQ